MPKTNMKGKKTMDFQNKRAHNLDTLVGIHKKNATVLETSLLANYGKLPGLSPKIGASLYQKSSN